MHKVHTPMATYDALRSINLNELLALDALLNEASVTRAAQRIGLSQSAMSHALGRLRRVLDDRLLVRSGNRFVLTPRAEQLKGRLRAGLDQLAEAVRGEVGFSPESSQRRFTIASADMTALRVLPALLSRVRDEAPQLELHLIDAGERTLYLRLEQGEVDLALTVARSLPPGFRRRKLYRESFACLARADHPRLRERRLTLEDFVVLPHALISPTGEGSGVVDRALAALGLERRILLRVQYFLVAPLLIAQSDLVLTAPRQLAAQFAEWAGLALFEPPLELPGFDIHAAWHERFQDDPGHRWLRQRLFASFDEQDSPAQAVEMPRRP
ncbi:MAG: LysR family transcriptional regulator [Myxococcales bacterium]|nr:LysR family transcriptional regulator [Myxococcales bacterium]